MLSKELETKLFDQACAALDDENMSEEQKNHICMMSAMVSIMNFEYPKNVRLEWEERQTIICEHFKPLGAVIMKYDPKVDGLAGCYLLWSCGDDKNRYAVKIDFEDSKTIETVKYIVVDVLELKEDEDEDYVIVHGCVRTKAELETICDLLLHEKLEEMKRVVLRWDPVEGERCDIAIQKLLNVL